ncbi:BRO family protein [Bifidobacterium myosotis]|uniref:BRO family protein n=1 Tax=Bifidobacterium myosotis TaxID=1630166 RepID=UPI00168B9079|nr:BRO family protein [Bifidobacterium myosotis]
MSNDIQLFDFEGTSVRTLTTQEGETWWVLTDVCKALGLSNPSVVAARIDPDSRSKSDLGRQGDTVIVNESGLYEVILRSDKPEAKRFRKWVTSEVLPSIRKHGAYMTENTLEKALTSPDFLIQLATQLKQERAEKEQALAESEKRGRQLAAVQETLDSIARLLDQQKPYAAIGSQFVQLDGTISIRDISRNFQQLDPTMSMRRVYQILRENGYIIHNGYAPTLKAIRPGYLKQRIGKKANGEMTRPYAAFTAKGIGWFISRFIYNQPEDANLDVPTLY